jgi:GNAT superfamily N-acetyltransferase
MAKSLELIQRLSKDGFYNPFWRNEFIIGEKVGLEVSAADENTVELMNIRALEKGQGYGSRGLKYLTDIADEVGANIKGVVVPTEQGGLTKKQLVRWYERHGFKVVWVRNERYPYIMRTPKRRELYK